MDDELYKRLVLMNQYMILSQVDRANAETWEHAAEVVRDNWPLDDLPSVDWLKESAANPLTEDHRTLIMDIMDLYDWLQRAEDDGHAPADGHPADFPGFDGNNETKFMAFARDLVTRQRRWTELRLTNRDFNSHHPTIAIYRRMIAEWQRRGKPFPIAGADYDAIMAARAHPA